MSTFPNPISFLTGGFSTAIGAIGGVLDKLTTSDAERLAAKAQLLQIQVDFETKLAAVDAQIAEQQAKVLVAEAQSESWLARNWRPILMLTFTYIIFHTFVLSPIFNVAAVEIPPDMWALLKLGIGGYIIGRTVEKVAPEVAANMRGPSTPH